MAHSSWPVILLFVAAIVIAVIVVRREEQSRLSASERAAITAGCGPVESAFRRHSSGTWLAFTGTVARLLTDTDGARVHQRFVVACPDRQTVLIVNDVSIGQRAPVHVGEAVSVRGQYIWNAEGGLVHFTHHSQGGVESGWILFQGQLYSLGRAPLS